CPGCTAARSHAGRRPTPGRRARARRVQAAGIRGRCSFDGLVVESVLELEGELRAVALGVDEGLALPRILVVPAGCRPLLGCDRVLGVDRQVVVGAISLIEADGLLPSRVAAELMREDAPGLGPERVSARIERTELCCRRERGKMNRRVEVGGRSWPHR